MWIVAFWTLNLLANFCANPTQHFNSVFKSEAATVCGTFIALHVKSPNIFSPCLQALRHCVSNIESSGKEIVKTQTTKIRTRTDSEPLHGVILDDAFLAVRGKLVQESEEEKQGAASGNKYHSDVLSQHASCQVKYIPRHRVSDPVSGLEHQTSSNRKALWHMLTECLFSTVDLLFRLMAHLPTLLR